jgi:hypothetical protein
MGRKEGIMDREDGKGEIERRRAKTYTGLYVSVILLCLASTVLGILLGPSIVARLLRR